MRCDNNPSPQPNKQHHKSRDQYYQTSINTIKQSTIRTHGYYLEVVHHGHRSLGQHPGHRVDLVHHSAQGPAHSVPVDHSQHCEGLVFGEAVALREQNVNISHHKAEVLGHGGQNVVGHADVVLIEVVQQLRITHGAHFLSLGFIFDQGRRRVQQQNLPRKHVRGGADEVAAVLRVLVHLPSHARLIGAVDAALTIVDNLTIRIGVLHQQRSRSSFTALEAISMRARGTFKCNRRQQQRIHRYTFRVPREKTIVYYCQL